MLAVLMHSLLVLALLGYNMGSVQDSAPCLLVTWLHSWQLCWTSDGQCPKRRSQLGGFFLACFFGHLVCSFQTKHFNLDACTLGKFLMLAVLMLAFLMLALLACIMGSVQDSAPNLLVTELLSFQFSCKYDWQCPKQCCLSL